VTKKYEVLLFDLDNTLFDFEHAEYSALQKTAEKYGGEIAFEEFEAMYHAVNKPLWGALERGEITSDIIKTERFVQLVDRLGLDFDPIDISQYYTKRLGEGIQKVPYAQELCTNLSKKYKLVALTNGIQSVQENRLRLSGLYIFFDAIIISEAVGFSKPDERIFTEALSRIGHKDRNTVLMIGDSLKADIAGAFNAGIDACWVNLKLASQPSEQNYKMMVHKLEDLEAILK